VARRRAPLPDTMEACDVFIGSTGVLCRHAEEVVVSPPSASPTEWAWRWPGCPTPRCPGPAGPAPSGSVPERTDTHDHDWRHVEPAVERLLESRPHTELWLVGLVRPSVALERFGPRVRHIPFQEWRNLPGLLRDLDVNLAPLQPGSRFNDAKSAIKWLEAALCATPTVASPSEPFVEAIRHGQNGMLAGNEDEWTSVLELLVDDGETRRRLGLGAQRDALPRWSPHLQANRYLEILEHGPERRGPAASADRASWVPVVHDEAPLPVGLEPYADVLPAPARPPLPGWRRLADQAATACRSLVAKGWRSMVREGPRITAQRAVAAARRGLRLVDDRHRWRMAVRRTRRPPGR